MIQIILTVKARDDLVRLRQFLAEENQQAARKAMAVLVEAIDSLADFPEIGKSVDSLPDMRVLTKSFGKTGYKIYYRWIPSLTKVLILTIKHQKEH
ncbi:MAG: type II toxin-antitoxin system RelE/ParE family toxin [Piscirickettsiaceae bacterium CG_4_10_14_3_um_filter_44_349]|nr:type II toxin-antitoxin system RelE/ParE family toxin [Thiomicrospira sp.]OIP96746.1 MAG: hypothetical protein AUK56_00590 [Thiomicrospira sp. CG2_30_44_34]PIQ04366.1 MAG: plasmid stabilization protein [Piscirickettsiaceae bacterium CG18_big_fil_WC_8_21_14_2_50_44_103]PIU37936.1 MAG: type II toxin-antitoxin system RelE/ParE family toxin [Piscirickettsiaceae bacterium CG07_land_8_20_14_0_80_44_28]PIW56596.1 MAG: type II toxin-antitoxin system RelE/ParE family toxin [Piscirickettsiaceae bacter